MNMVVGTGRFTYEVVPDWGKLPQEWEWGQVPAVAVDSQDRVYVFNRSPHPVLVFDRGGNFIASWGEGTINQAHGIYIDKNNNLFLVDSHAHVVMKFTPEGKLLMMLGNRDQPSDTGFTEDSPSVKRPAGPFNRPTDIACSPSGDIYVSDGYRNARIHKFSADGQLLISWGEPGDGPGKFNIPHCVWEANDGRVYVADRGNNRIQVFTPNGEHLETWPGFFEPCKIFVDSENIMYVAEVSGRVTICSLDGIVLARIGGGDNEAPSPVVFPHGIWADSHGDLYIAETRDRARLQKFVRKG